MLALSDARGSFGPGCRGGGVVGITAHLGLFREAQLKAGEKVFVNGGTGGVGSCVVQMARAVGARVFTTAGSDEKVQICRQLGATGGQLQDRQCGRGLGKFRGPSTYGSRLLREQNLERAIEHLAYRGRIIVMAGRDVTAAVSVGPFYVKDGRLFGFAMFNAPAEEQRKCAAEINRWLAKGKLRPRIDRVMLLPKPPPPIASRKRTRSATPARWPAKSC